MRLSSIYFSMYFILTFLSARKVTKDPGELRFSPDPLKRFFKIGWFYIFILFFGLTLVYAIEHFCFFWFDVLSFIYTIKQMLCKTKHFKYYFIFYMQSRFIFTIWYSYEDKKRSHHKNTRSVFRLVVKLKKQVINASFFWIKKLHQSAVFSIEK